MAKISKRVQVELEAQEKARSIFSKHNKKKKSKRERTKHKTAQEMMLMPFLGRSQYYVNDPYLWKSKSHNQERQIRDFAEYVYCKYPVPSFMFSVFYENYRENAERYFRWFICIAHGKSFQKKVNYLLTKKEAHLFLYAPFNRIEQNLWYVRCMSKGLSVSMTRFLIDNLLVNVQFVDSWYMDFLHIISKEDEEKIDKPDLINLKDFVTAQLRDNPNFSLKGRTIGSLIKLSNEWHRDIANRSSLNRKLTWSGIDIPDYKWYQKDMDLYWYIRQLKSSHELYIEGQKMRHCVAGYDMACSEGYSFIFSLYSLQFSGDIPTKHLTIEITKDKRLRQARGKHNIKPKGVPKMVLDKWMSLNNIKGEV